METLAGLWAPILLSAVLVFVASSIIWNVLGAHKWHVRGLPDEPAAVEVLRKQGLTPAQYAFPYSSDPKAMREPAFMEKFKTGPVGLLIIRPSGPVNLGRFLTHWFLYLLFVSAFVAWVTGQVLPFRTPYPRVFLVAGSLAVAAYSFAQIPNAIWWGRPWKSALKEVADGILYGLLTAGTFGWLWPR